MPTGNFRDFNLLRVDIKCCSCPSASCASAANGISWDIGAVQVLFGLTICNLIVIITSSPNFLCSYCIFSLRFIIFHVFIFVVCYFMCFLICSFAVPVIGLLALAS